METKKIEDFQFITNQWSDIDIEDQVRIICAAGCRWIQLRLKDFTYAQSKFIAEHVKEICSIYDVTLIINDNVALAKVIEADGVHLGSNDMTPELARKILGDDAIIGGTANNFETIQDLYNQGVDYIGLGPFKFTETKKNLAPVLGTEGYLKIIQSCEINNINTPIVGIGGITSSDIPSILNTGIYGIAVSSVISDNSNPSRKTKQILKTIKSNKYASVNNC